MVASEVRQTLEGKFGNTDGLITVPDSVIALGTKIGKLRHGVNASDTRGAGKNERFHIQGAVGEAVVAWMLDLSVEPEFNPNGVGSRDLIPGLEVKNGAPLAFKRTHKDSDVYVVVSEFGHPGVFEYRVASGAAIRYYNGQGGNPEYAKERLERLCPRPGTAEMNYYIPTVEEYEAIL